MEEEQLQPTPEPEQDNEITPSPDSQEKNENAGITPTPESPENTGFSEDGNDVNVPGIENNASENDAESGAENENQQDQESETEEDGDGSTTNITIIRPPAQITYNTSADTEATYHVTVENETDAPVPVLVTETLIEPDPGIMEKKLEDYTVTEALLLLILITLWLRIIFDYFGRRRT